MEIERKFLLHSIPNDLQSYPHYEITQAYLCTEPVIRIRQKDDRYILTYKSSGMRSRLEEEMPLTKAAFQHLLAKADGNVISKTRYLIPDNRPDRMYTIELDAFHGVYEGIWLAEVEFDSEQDADNYTMPEWFREDVTYDGSYHNSRLSTMEICQIQKLVEKSAISNNI